MALKLGYILIAPPKINRLCPWEYDRVIYRWRNEIERLFRRLKGFRRVFSRFDKLDVMFVAFAGERFDAVSVQNWRKKALRSEIT